jgi:hypothetical protein
MRVGENLAKGGKAEGSVIREEYRGNIAQKFGLGVPEYRMFGELVRTLFESASAQGAKLVWGFPNEAALKPQIRAGYSYHPIVVHNRVLPFDHLKTAQVVYHRAPLGPTAKKLLIQFGRIYCRLRTIGKRRVPNSTIEVRRITADDLDERFRGFVKKCLSRGEMVTVEREPEYVRWRFLDNPVVPHQVYIARRSGEITAMVVTDVGEGGGARSARIVDMLALEDADDDLLALVVDVAGRLKADGCVCVRTWMSECPLSKKYLRTLRRAGFINLPTGVKKSRLHLIYKTLDQTPDISLLDDPRNWYITIAFTEGTSQ